MQRLHRQIPEEVAVMPREILAVEVSCRNDSDERRQGHLVRIRLTYTSTPKIPGASFAQPRGTFAGCPEALR